MRDICGEAFPAKLAQKRSLLLEVPSVLIAESSIVQVNTLHHDARLLKIVATYRQAYDERFFH
ncbi:MAG TPA: hypothetical protein VGD59_15445 [Acidisarcina sp.]